MSAIKYKFTSKTGGFESYDSHQLLCGGMVEVNSEPFRIAWFSKRLYIHPGLFGGSKIVRLKGLIGSLQKTNQVAVGSIHVFSKLGCVFIKV